jgi:hypothetical protein
MSLLRVAPFGKMSLNSHGMGLRPRLNEKGCEFSHVIQSIVNLIPDWPKGLRGESPSEHFRDPFRQLYERVRFWEGGGGTIVITIDRRIRECY